MSRVVVADAGPLIGLSRVGLLSLLPDLYGTITITQAVHDEILAQPAGRKFEDQAQLRAALSDWLKLDAQQLPLIPGLISRNPHLGAGEWSSICLCIQLGTSLLIVDDKAAREEAAFRGIAITGLLGVLLLAHERKLIPQFKPVLHKLAEQGYFLGQRLTELALKRTGEA
jgi:predicted nucleic acid-binding protein